jgi:antitoxin component YwqK of YwqJK toxin-antitoxin module
MAGATERIWMPMGTPQVTPAASAQSTPQQTVQPTETAPVQSAAAPSPSGAAVTQDGHWIFAYPDGKTQSEGDYVGGKKDGIWKYWREDGSEEREMEFKAGALTGNVLLYDPAGNQAFFDHFTDLIAKNLPYGFKIETVLPYLMDLGSDGQDEIVLIVRPVDAATPSQLQVLDNKGAFLDGKDTDGLADDLVFGTVKKGAPVCFGYDSGCALSGGTCNWEFDQFTGGKIKRVLQYQGWYGQSGPFTLPVFRDQGDGTNEIVTDNGTFKWNDQAGQFKIAK